MRRKVQVIASLLAFSALLAPATPAVAGTGNLIAPQSACPNQEQTDLPPDAQEATMICMTDFARRQAGLAELGESETLHESAVDKSEDVIRCDEFSHFACGRDFEYWLRETGYISVACWHVGEDLAWGIGREGSVRAIFRAWMRSPDHRKNLLGSYEQIGVSLLLGDLEGQAGVRVWAAHFGTRCSAE